MEQGGVEVIVSETLVLGHDPDARKNMTGIGKRKPTGNIGNEENIQSHLLLLSVLPTIQQWSIGYRLQLAANLIT